MALTDLAVKGAKPKDKDYKLADDGSLYLLVTKAGGSYGGLNIALRVRKRNLALVRTLP